MSLDIDHQDILDMNGWTIADCSAVLTETFINNAIDYINSMISHNIAQMSGSAGSKTISLTAKQRVAVKNLAALYVAAKISGGSAIGLNIKMGEFKSEKVTDFPVQLFIDTVKAGIRKLMMATEIPATFYNPPFNTA